MGVFKLFSDDGYDGDHTGMAPFASDSHTSWNEVKNAKAFAPTPGQPSGLGGPVKAPNPDPKNFKIIWAEEVQPTDGGTVRTVAKVNYPDCTNFEGNKIMVFNAPKAVILTTTELDPHFSGKILSPMARFEPTKTGESHALTFAKHMASGYVE